MRTLLVLALSGFLLIAACSEATGNETPRLPEYGAVGELDVIGEVTAAEFGAGWEMSPREIGLAVGGPGEVTVGPLRLRLSNGQTLDVNEGTPGGNRCLSLIHPSQVAAITGESTATLDDVPRFNANYDWTVPCVIAGQVDSSRDVAWFEVLYVQQHDGVFLAEAGRVVEVDEAGSMVTTTRGYMLPLAVDQSTCGTPAAEATAAMALVDWLAGHVAALECIERG